MTTVFKWLFAIRRFLFLLFGIPEVGPPLDHGGWVVWGNTVLVHTDRSAEVWKNGGAIRVEHWTLPFRALVFRGDDGELHAIENRCTYSGRRLHLLHRYGMMRACSLTGSTYDYDGKPVVGAAHKPLRHFYLKQIKLDEDMSILLYDPPKSITRIPHDYELFK